MNRTGIPYADFTWNPFVGCSRASEGCTHCYAEKLATTRLRHLPEYAAATTENGWNGRVVLRPERLSEPIRRRRPAVIFLGDMGDIFHPTVPFEFIAAVWATMILAYRCTFLVLTKRPQKMLDVLTADGFYQSVLDAARPLRDKFPKTGMVGISNPSRFPPKNVWLGTTAENQARADERIPLLLQTPAARRCEPGAAVGAG